MGEDDVPDPGPEALIERIVELERDRAILFGHRGQPGAIRAMGHRIDAHDLSVTRLSERITPLERLRWQAIGGSVVAGAFVSIVVLLISKLWR